MSDTESKLSMKDIAAARRLRGIAKANPVRVQVLERLSIAAEALEAGKLEKGCNAAAQVAEELGAELGAELEAESGSGLTPEALEALDGIKAAAGNELEIRSGGGTVGAARWDALPDLLQRLIENL